MKQMNIIHSRDTIALTLKLNTFKNNATLTEICVNKQESLITWIRVSFLLIFKSLPGEMI